MHDEVISLLGLLATALLLLVLRSFFPGYLAEKGKNLATKEDVATITAKVEEVKELYTRRIKDLEHQNALVLEQLRAQQQLRLAAVERRLAAHQEAFALWRRLVASAHSDAVQPIVLECQEWWERNCLYLSAEARDSFNLAYFNASSHRELIKGRVDAAEVKRNWSSLLKAGDDLVAGVQLPPLGEREAKSAA